jgi:OOP family OmpA-OmpF porin
MSKKWGLLMCLSAMSVMGMAQDATGRIGIGGWGGWSDAIATDPLNEYNDSSEGWGVYIRKGISANNEISVSYDQLRLDTKDTEENIVFQPVMLNWIHSLGSNSRLKPFISLGAGATTTKHLDSEYTRRTVFGAKAGLGLELFITKNLSIGALGNYHYAAKSDSDLTNEASVLSGGLMVNLFFQKSKGEPQVQKTAAPEPVVVAEPVAAPVTQPAPVAAPAAVVAAPVAAVMIDEPKDSDSDGVIDTLDKCPDTTAGVLVDLTGCPAQKVSVTLDVKFATGKSDVDPKYDGTLAKAAAFMKSHPTTTVEIEGHSDNVGDKAKNKDLSSKRAQSVRQALITKHGADAARLKAVGYGDERPIADNATPEGRETNRRVMATITTIP